MMRAIGKALGALVAALLVMSASAARAEDVERPVLLLATPQVEGLYSHTALLVVPLADKHVGFILNLATDLDLDAVLPGSPGAKAAPRLYFGGPDAADSVFAVVARDPGKPSVHLFADLFITNSAKTISQLMERSPGEARFFAGFVNWKPGELAEEIDAGYWYVTEPDPALVFREDPGAIWEDLVKRFGGGYT
jgi:putative transcriptional regulator